MPIGFCQSKWSLHAATITRRAIGMWPAGPPWTPWHWVAWWRFPSASRLSVRKISGVVVARGGPTGQKWPKSSGRSAESITAADSSVWGSLRDRPRSASIGRKSPCLRGWERHTPEADRWPQDPGFPLRLWSILMCRPLPPTGLGTEVSAGPLTRTGQWARHPGTTLPGKTQRTGRVWVRTPGFRKRRWRIRR